MEGFFIGHPKLTSILSKLFMYMSTMTIQSKSNLLYILLFGVDFDSDCVHIYYPQSLVRDQLNSCPTRKVLSRATHDSLLTVKQMSSRTIVRKEFARYLANVGVIFTSGPVIARSFLSWTVAQMVEGALPAKLTCQGDKHLNRGGTVGFDKETDEESFSFNRME